MTRIALTVATAVLTLATVSVARSEDAPPPPPAAAAPAPVAKPAHARQSLQQHFDLANTSHDGQLTQSQAAAAKWSYVEKHFAAIDKGHRGFVTVDDIHAYAHLMHAAHRAAPKPAAPAVVSN